MKCDVLFFGAHPDDVELGCGGTVHKLVKQGYQVGIIDLTRGELGTRGDEATRKQEAENAAKILGIAVRDNCGISDGHIDNSRENKAKVITMIRKYRPELVILPYFSDRHPDHVNASKLVKECIYYAGTEKWPTGTPTSELPAHRPKQYLYYMLAEPFMPNVIVDITAEFEVRQKAFQAYKSQFFVPGHVSDDKETWISKPEFAESLVARVQFYGFQGGCRYAEPFFAEQPLKLDDLMMLTGK
ncbi:MAG: bacillithiol biosynthesis deacetylase BshB1 [Bacteroidetes bacterium]|nr:bacillithiol biosynthesis deacetylase BshB1 [Bacteroidota bacterium]